MSNTEIKFVKVSKYKDVEIAAPIRATDGAAGYDMVAAEDTIIPSYLDLVAKMNTFAKKGKVFTIDEMSVLTKEYGTKPSLVPTGYKVYLPDGYSCDLEIRSSSPLKYWIIMANAIGLIDSDYADNEDNEGHIYFQLVNLSPFPIKIQKGEALGQAVIRPYSKTIDDAEQDSLRKKRVSGLGSTTVTPEVKSKKYIKRA